MRRINVLLWPLLLVACSGGGGTAPVVAPTTGELQAIDTLRELDERSDALIAAAKFQTARKELNDLADAASHQHSDRSSRIKEWRDAAFANAPKAIALPACAQGDFAVPNPATDRQLVERFIAHRECAVMFARDALASVRSSNARRLLEDSIRAYEAELQQLRPWGTQWQ